MPMAIISLLTGVLLAGLGGELFLRGVLGFARWMRIPTAIAAATLGAFATSSPEVFVSSSSAPKGEPAIGLMALDHAISRIEGGVLIAIYAITPSLLAAFAGRGYMLALRQVAPSSGSFRPTFSPQAGRRNHHDDASRLESFSPFWGEGTIAAMPRALNPSPRLLGEGGCAAPG